MGRHFSTQFHVMAGFPHATLGNTSSSESRILVLTGRHVVKTGAKHLPPSVKSIIFESKCSHYNMCYTVILSVRQRHSKEHDEIITSIVIVGIQDI